MVVICYAAKLWKMIKISKMDVLKIRVLLTASPLRGSMRGGRLRAPTCAKRLVGVTHRLAPAALSSTPPALDGRGAPFRARKRARKSEALRAYIGRSSATS